LGEKEVNQLAPRFPPQTKAFTEINVEVAKKNFLRQPPVAI
jgi:hypothetical protein